MSITRDEWLQALRDASLQVEIDEDAITIAEFAALTQCGKDAARARMALLCEQGKAVQVLKQKRNSRGALVRIPAYRLVTAHAAPHSIETP